ncbi:hypothetical protein HDU97_009290 [Phlyctochytrium planicorne]|nr:hypothetical protein HDU97_009290 [Phlyctochytrium planicorne]
MRSFLVAAVLAFSSAVSAQSFDYSYGSSDVSVVATNEAFKCVSPQSHGICNGELNVTVALAVRNRAFVKDVGVRYTNDSSWSFVNEVFGSYDRKLNDQFELWNVVIPVGAVGSFSQRPEIVMAAFTAYNKAPRVWDPQNNYYSKTKPSSPITFINDKVDYDSNLKKITLEGSVRIYSANRAADFKTGSLNIHWTVDSWGTSNYSPAKVPADARDGVWTFSIPLPDNAVTSPSVSYEYRYLKDATSGTFSRNLKPNVYFDGFQSGKVLTGFQSLSNFVFTDIPVSTTVSFDNGPKVDVPGQEYRLDTTKLSNGKHNVTVVSSVAKGGPVFYTNTFEVTVDNHVDFKKQSTLVAPSFGPYASSSAGATFKDKIYLGVEGVVVKYESINNQSPVLTYKGPIQSYSKILSVAVDDSSVYALDLWSLYKFVESTGAVDTKFATNGTLNLNRDAVYDGLPVCNSNRIAVVGDALLIQDFCNFRILKFSAATGAFVSSLSTDNRRPNAFGVDGKEVIVAMTTNDNVFVARIDPSTNTFVANSTVSYPSSGTDEIEAIAKADNAYVTIRLGQRLEFLSASGNDIVARWQGGSASNLPGQFYNAQSILPLNDGTIIVPDYYTFTVGGETKVKLQIFGNKLI